MKKEVLKKNIVVIVAFIVLMVKSLFGIELDDETVNNLVDVILQVFIVGSVIYQTVKTQLNKKKKDKKE